MAKLLVTVDGVEYNVEITGSLADLLPVPPAPAPAHRNYPPPAGVSGDVGPCHIVGIEVNEKNRAGQVMNAPKFTVKFDNGKSYSTFQSGIGNAAKTLWGMGRPVFYKTAPSQDGKYTNLAEVRSADGQP